MRDPAGRHHVPHQVSMKSGLEGRNNHEAAWVYEVLLRAGLNEVRPRRPEQFFALADVVMALPSQ